ncbi:hypothetical protein DHEL01_v205303 [Diaporthe helianthi]|uniref:Uncharacterized protein n=1 Tax=Diaporthe helianthi TaxID=158607 RepID=A0A2P5I1H6_DIAHE|nr:hypothetical protein DHEL01_v205303 [Diaporthe helianthi]
MASAKRRRDEDDDSPQSKRNKSNGGFTIKDFMADFPPLKGPMVVDKEMPLPSTFLADHELQDASARKPPFGSTFNVALPAQLRDHDKRAALDAPYKWMKKQYSHCIIPELGEEYDFAYDSDTFHTLRDLHNARVQIRQGKSLRDYIIQSLATRWLSLAEEGRPSSDGYLGHGEIFVATFLPLSDDNDELKLFFESNYSGELSAQHYIPRSKYSVHFVGEPNKSISGEILSVHVGSVLIRNTRTGQVIHLDTGATRTTREDRSRRAGRVLKSWFDFLKEKCPDADLGPIATSVPLIIDVDKETHPTQRSIHALVSATLFLKRRVTNWGDMMAFTIRGKPSSKTMANCALRSISGWLGLKSPRDTFRSNTSRKPQTFQNNYEKGALSGRQQPVPESQRIRAAKKGEPLVYNTGAGFTNQADSDNEADSDDAAGSDDEAASDNENSLPDTTHESVSGDEETASVDRPSDDDQQVQSVDYEVSKTEESEHEHSNTADTQYEMAIDEKPKNDKSNKEDNPKKNGPHSKRHASEDIVAKKSDSARASTINVRNLRSSA